MLQNILEYFYKIFLINRQFGVTFECFASPFNCYFRQFWTDRRLAFYNSNADFKVIKWRNIRDKLMDV